MFHWFETSSCLSKELPPSYEPSKQPCVYFNFSLKTGDKDLEAEVEDRLLIKFYGCAWSDEFENEDHCNIKYKASLQETEVGAT